MNQKQNPYRLYLTEDQMPKQYYNLRADMKELPEPMLNPITKKEVTLEDLLPVFCKELAKQELDNETRYIDIPKEVQEMYRIYRPSPLIRAYNLEKYLETPAKIYYKFEGNNTSGSHKLNSAIAQVYYAKQEGITNLTTETGAGQWGTALAEACSYFDIPLSVYMVKASYEQKPFRKDIMRTFGANVIASPSNTTDVGRKILKEHPNTTGSLGCAISEAVEKAVNTPNSKYVLGSVLNQVLLHQSIIGLECEIALNLLNEYPNIIIGCAGGGSNLGGLIAPFMRDKIKGISNPRIIAVEPASCPSLTRGKYVYDYCDNSNKSQYYIFVLPLDKKLNLKSVQLLLEETRLSFGDEKVLYEKLAVKIGSVSIFNVINLKKKDIIFVLDENILNYEKVAFHPNINTETVIFHSKEIYKIFEFYNIKYKFLTIQ